MGRISASYRSPHSTADESPDRSAPVDDAARRLVRQLASAHRDLPEEVITRQVGEVRAALGWLGDDPEVNATLEKAVDHNLAQIETALASGAGLSQQAPSHERPRTASRRKR